MSTDVLDPPTDQATDPQEPGPKASTLEQTLAEQANAAIVQGRDPKQVTDRLGVMVKHLRENPGVATHGNAALARGADPRLVASRTWQLASSGAGNINLTGEVPKAPGVTSANQPGASRAETPDTGFDVGSLAGAGRNSPIRGAPVVQSDVARVGAPPNSKGTPLPPDSWKPSGIAAAIARHAVFPAMENPLSTVATMGGGAITGVPLALQGAKRGVEYGAQKAAEMTLPPDVRALAEKDPSRISGGEAAVNAGMLALPLLHGGVRSVFHGAPEVDPVASSFGDLAREMKGTPPVTEAAAQANFVDRLQDGIPAANKAATGVIPKPEGFRPGLVPSVRPVPDELVTDKVGPHPLVKLAPKVSGNVEGLESSEPVEVPSRPSRRLAGVESLPEEAARHAAYDKAVNDAAVEYDERAQEEKTRQEALRALTGVKRRPAVVAPIADEALPVERTDASPASLPEVGARPEREPFYTPKVGSAPESVPSVPERGAVPDVAPLVRMPAGPEVPRNVFGPKEAGVARARVRAREFARANLTDRTFTNSVTGWDVRLSTDAIDHTLRPRDTANWHESFAALSALPEIIRNADLTESQPTRGGGTKAADVPFHHKLTASMSIDGEPHTVTLTVRELAGALDKKLYSVRAIKVEPDATNPGPVGTPPRDQISGSSGSPSNLAESRAPGEPFAMGGRESRIPKIPRGQRTIVPRTEPVEGLTGNAVDAGGPAYKGPAALYDRLSNDALGAEYRALLDKRTSNAENAVAPLWDAEREARAVDQVENRRRPDGSFAPADKHRLATLQAEQGEGYGQPRHTFASASADNLVKSYTRHIDAIEREMQARGIDPAEMARPHDVSPLPFEEENPFPPADLPQHGRVPGLEPETVPTPGRATFEPAALPRGESTGETITTNTEKFAPEFRGQVDEALGNSGAEREVVPIAQGMERVRSLAQDIGADPLSIDPKKVGRMSGEEIVAMRSAAQQHMAQIAEWSKQLADPNLPIEQREQIDYLVREARQARDNLIEGVSRAASQKGRDLNFLKQMAQHSLDPDVWEAQAKALAGDRVLSDDVIAETRRLAKLAMETCNG